MNSIKVKYKMDTKNTKTSEAYRLLHNLANKIDLKRSDKSVAYQVLACTTYQKI